MSAVTRPSWLWIAVLAATLVLAPLLAWQLGSADPREREARALERALRCPVCEGQSVADSNSAVALEMRQEIRRMLAEGRNRDEILQSFADRYGAWVVYMPPRHGWYVLGWAAPFLAVAAGAGLLAWWWRQGPRGTVPRPLVPGQAVPAGEPAGDEPAPGSAGFAASGAAPPVPVESTEGVASPAGPAGDRSSSAGPLEEAVRRWM
ncbi:cytochrome C biogenesis protein [Thermaerobacter sp. PB12/4term]|nr:cytochrome C biogenesis protein [Thermaerobacter sp. PB12/4term]